MLRAMLCLLVVVGLASAQQPKADPPGKADPAPPPNRFPGSARAVQEEVEQLEAHLATKLAYVKAAEVAVEGPKVKLTRLARLAAAGTVTADEVEGAKVEVKLAEAQVAIRKAEANEVAVRLKQVQRRVERMNKQAAAEPKLRELAAAVEKARGEAEEARRQVEPLRRAYDQYKAVATADSPVLVKAERSLKEAVTRAETAQLDADLKAAELDRLRQYIEDGREK